MTGQELKEIRKKWGMSKKDAARVFGYSLRTWQAYEGGSANARIIKPNLIVALKFYELIAKSKRPLK